VDPSRALWIGGPPGSGASSVAAALADRFALALYRVDDHASEHERRLPPSAVASPAPDEMLRSFVTHSRHRFRLVLEDLRELPDEPAAIVEGAHLFPTSVSAVLREPAHALFLLAEVGDPRDRLIAAAVEREARELRLPTLAVDAPIDELIERAAGHFAPIVGRQTV
jgi:2-phosphoglycerate kinase